MIDDDKRKASITIFSSVCLACRVKGCHGDCTQTAARVRANTPAPTELRPVPQPTVRPTQGVYTFGMGGYHE